MDKEGLLQGASVDEREQLHGVLRAPDSKTSETLELRIDSTAERQEWKHINPATVDDISVTESPRRVKMINSEVSSIQEKKTPMSPGKRALRVITSPIWMPAQYVARKFRAGGVKGSIFTLMSAILGAGILTLPYAVYANGLILGPILIIIGALLSYYTGYLLCLVGQKLNKQRYEDIAQIIYGRKMSLFAAALIVVNLLGVVIAYIVLVSCTSFIQIKSLIPHTIDAMSKGRATGVIKNQILWATIVSYGVIFPLSLLRKMSSLRFSSIFGFACVLYLTILIIVQFFVVTKDKSGNWERARLFHVSVDGIFGSFPLVIFAFLYQPNIPSIYMELNNKSLKRMDKVLTRGSIICIVIYIVVGIMGYATFSDKNAEMEKKNILAASAYSSRIECQIAFIFLSLVIFAASPVCIKPVKDSFQLIFWKGAELSDMANFWLTFGLVTACYGLAVVVPIISDVIQVLGDTCSPLVCFTLPIMFYLKIDQSPSYSCNRVFAHFINVITLLIGVLGLASFIMDKLDVKLE